MVMRTPNLSQRMSEEPVTVSQGNVVWQDGELRTVRGAGRYIDRPCFAKYYAATERVRELAEPSPVHRGGQAQGREAENSP